MKNQAWKKY